MNWKMVGISLILAAVLGVSFIASQRYLKTTVVTPQTSPPPDTPTTDEPSAAGPGEVVPKVLVRLSDQQIARVSAASGTGQVPFEDPVIPDVIVPDTDLFSSPDTPVEAPAAAEPPPASAVPETPTPTPTPTPSPAASGSASPSPTVLGTSTADTAAILAAVPELSIAGVQNVRFVVPPKQSSGAGSSTSGDSAVRKIFGWVEITFEGEEYQALPVKNTFTLEPLPIRPFLEEATDVEHDPQFQSQPVPQAMTVAQSEALTRLQQRITTLREAARGFEKVEAALVLRPSVVPNDPYFSSTGAWRQSYEDLWGLKKIQAPTAWDKTTGTADTVIAVIDTGVDVTHRDLQGNIWENSGETGTDAAGRDKKANGVDDDQNGYVDDWRGWNFAQDTNDVSDPPHCFHGTHVAGTIAAKGNNAQDIAGVMWQAKVMSLPFLQYDDNCSGDSVGGASALVYAADNGARVTNNSWGSEGYSDLLADAVSYVNSKNVVTVAAAGNSNSSRPHYPSSYPEVISVGASTHTDSKASFSNWGESLDIMAPGNEILSLLATGAAEHLPSFYLVGEHLLRLRGTSMASPHVAGVAGLLFALHPDWSAHDVQATILSTADDIGAPGRDAQTGAGRLNAGQALSVEAPKHVTSIITSPTEGFYITREQTLEIKGTATARPFSHYVVEVGEGDTPTTWQTTNLRLTNDGRAEVNDDVLATWDTRTLLTTNKLYTLRLTVHTANNATSVARVKVMIDSTVRPGWSRTAPTVNASAIPMVANVVGDSKKEVIVQYTGGVLTVFDSEGRTVPGWPRVIGNADWSLVTVSAADIEGDAHDELIVTEGNAVYAFDGSGQVFSRWFVQVTNPLRESLAARPTFVDLEGDGTLEMLFYTIDIPGDKQGILRVYSIERDGKLTPGWPKVVTNPQQEYIWCNECTPIVPYDLNGDGKLELIFHSKTFFSGPFEHQSAVYVLSNDGTALPGWPKQLTVADDIYYVIEAILVGDVKGDANPEIVVIKNARGRIFGGNDQSFEVHIIDQGRNESVIPIPGHIIAGDSFGAATAPSLADVDRDGKMDIVLGPHVIKGDGSSPRGWTPPAVDGKRLCNLNDCLPQKIIRGGSILADIGGSPDLDILTAPEWDDTPDQSTVPVPAEALISAYQFDGTPVPGWPKRLPVHLDPRYDAVAADLDNNGTMEVAASLQGGTVVVWDTSGKPAAGEWKFPHNTNKHYRWFVPRPVTSASPTPTTTGVPACAQGNSAAFVLLDVNPKDGALTTAEVDPIITRVQEILNNCLNNSCYVGNEQFDLNKDGNLTAVDVLQLVNVRTSCVKQ